MKRTFALLLLGILTVVSFGVTVFILSKNLGKGALQITSEPNSKVYLDGNYIGTTPLCKCDANTTIPEGTYTVKLTASEGNFPPFEQKISISSKVLTVVDRTFADGSSSSGSVITLTKLPDKNAVSLMVTSFPDNAKVFLDSGFVGDSPLLLNDVTDSDHELKLSKSGYKDKILKIRTSKGYKLESQVYMAANPQESVSTPSATLAPNKVMVLILDTPTGFLRVRDSASLGGNQIGQVLPGEKYELLDEQNGWYKIKLKDGTSGWISSQYAQKQS